jgi:hypothetical protein
MSRQLGNLVVADVLGISLNHEEVTVGTCRRHGVDVHRGFKCPTRVLSILVRDDGTVAVLIDDA